MLVRYARSGGHRWLTSPARSTRGRYGPTTDDRVRLGDTDLWVRVEDDHVGFGDEPIWGYAKNFRSRMAQFDRATSESELDMLIAGVVVIDPFLGVVKTNIGIKDGRIAGIGRAGSPDITDGVELVIGPNTWPVNGYGLIATAGADRQPRPPDHPSARAGGALSAGVTTLISAGFEEPAYTMDKTYRAFEGLPVNLGLQASARTDVPGQIERVIEAGACGLKIHEDWGAYPEIVDATLGTGRRARRRGMPAHRRAERVLRARGHGRGDRGPRGPRLSRRRAQEAGTCRT